MNEDRDLRDAFTRLRDADSNIVPKFAMPCAQLRRRRHMPVAIAVALIVVGIALTIALRRPVTQRIEVATPVAMSTWRSPTDFLLKTPGCDLTASVPNLQPQLPKINKGDRS